MKTKEELKFDEIVGKMNELCKELDQLKDKNYCVFAIMSKTADKEGGTTHLSFSGTSLALAEILVDVMEESEVIENAVRVAAVANNEALLDIFD